MKKKVVALTLAAVLAFSMTACGSGSSTSTSTSTGSDSTETAAASEDSAKEDFATIERVDAESDEAGSYYRDLVPGSVINIGVSGSVTSWAPFSNGMGSDAGPLGGMVYQTLMTMELEPLLAYEYEAVDETTYDFHIWDNITDSIGNPITADDIVFCYEQAIEAGNAHGIDIITGVSAVDDYTVEFELGHVPYIGDLESIVGQISIVSRKSYEESEDGMVSKPIGSGPYTVETWVADSITTLKARDDYWAKPEQVLSSIMEQTVETVNYKTIGESSQMTIGLQNGDIDFSNSITTEDLVFFEEGGEYSDSYHVDILPEGLTNYLLCNNSDASVCSNLALREAVYYAIDAQALVNGVANGRGILTHDGSNSSLVDYNPAWDTEDNFYNYNVETAKAKLEEAGYKEGELTLRLFCESGDDYTNMATLIQALLLQAGINVDIEPYEPTMLASYVADNTQWDLLLCCFGSEDYIVNNWAHIFDPANWSWGQSYNFIDDEHLTELLYTCKSLDGHTEENLDAFHQYTVENAYAMGLYNGYTCSVVSNKITAYYNVQNGMIVQATIFNE